MKNKEDKNIEKLVENLMSETTLESPSIDFTAKVMSGVFAVKKRKLVYKPPISKWAWYIIFGSFAFLFAFVIYNNQQNTATDSYFNFTFFNSEKFFNLFSRFQISSMTANVLLAASAMLFIQIFLLRSYLNKRFHK